MHTRTVIGFHLIPSEARPCHLYSTRLLDTSEVLISADSPARVLELDRLCVHLASCSNGERHVPPPFVRRHMISVMASDIVSLNAANAVTIIVIILSNPSGDHDTMPASSAYSIPHNVWAASSFFCLSTLPTRALPSFFSPFSPFLHAVADCISGEAVLRHTQHRREKNVEQQWREHTPLPKTLLHIEHIRALATFQPHACPHAVVELANDGE